MPLKLCRLLSLSLLALLPFVSAGCFDRNAQDAQQLVDQAISAHGGDRYENSQIDFRFREKRFRVMRKGDDFVYSSTFADSAGNRIHDVLRNSGFTRTVNDAVVQVSEEERAELGEAVKSVVYFALLPYGLNDSLAVKRYVGEAIIRGEPYHKVAVGFRETEGGRHVKDTYVYWFHQRRHTLDYLAYTFQVDGGGSRFREAVNSRVVGGIRFQDYINYTTKDNLPPERYDKVFEVGKLDIFSVIDLEEVQVSDLPAI